jgi:glycosyltransferase involved in cell wall biosynthesis
MNSSYCLVVPHFNHDEAFAKFLPRLIALNLPCLVVDDGSDVSSLQRLKQSLERYPQVILTEHVRNRGKGAAMITAATIARLHGHTHMLQIDADGQHNAADVPTFIEVSRAHPTSIVSGAPQFDETAPKARVYGRKVTDFWVALETGSLAIKDSLCGFRVYPLDSFEQILDRYHIGKRMDFDTDILVKSMWDGIGIEFVDTDVIYHNNSVSHFHYWKDNWRLIWLHTRLMTGMVVRLPLRLIRKVRSLMLHHG